MPGDSDFAFGKPLTESGADLSAASDAAAGAQRALDTYKPEKDFGQDDRRLNVKPFGSNPHGSIDASGKVHGM